MAPSRQQVLQQLQAELQRREHGTGGVTAGAAGGVSTGIFGLDELLGGNGLAPGSLVEWLAFPGSGAGELGLRCVPPVQQAGRALVVVDLSARFYAPAAAAQGIDLAETILVRPRYPADALWALEQALHCPGVGVVWCWLEQVPERAFRRLQLAAEAGGSLGVLIRPEEMRTRPSWADVRWLVQPVPRPPGSPDSGSPDSSGRRVRVELHRCRGVFGGER